LLPLRHGRRDAGRARRRLARERARPDRVQLDLFATRDAARADRGRVAEGALQAPRRVERRPHDRRDDGELHRPRGGAPLVAAPADLAAEHGAWLHVDGAFGLFAAVSPATRELVAGIERAHSVAVDGHKWLNVPYDCGAAFVHDPELHHGAFTSTAAYLGREE